MKIRFLQIISLLIAILMLFASCNAVDVPSLEDEETNTTVTDVQTNNDVYIERPDKEVKNILMIGNSFCTRYLEELYGIAKADGYELVVASLYESGCPVADHWKWIVDGSSEYILYIASAKYKGTRKQINGTKVSMQWILDYAKNELGGDWDVITLQQHFNPTRASDYKKGYLETSSYSKKLFDRLGKEHPEAIMYWHETWAYQVGFNSGGEAILDVATQTLTYENIKKISEEIAAENGVNMIPCGDAWQIARSNEIVGDNMCARLDENGGLGDYYHDGDIGGGQYLNACVWYEVLMGESCIGNTWRPDYELSEEMIAVLQEAAHTAVAAIYGPGYAK